jgi:hypothetical protein
MPETIPIACSLEPAELPDRAQLISALGESLEAVDAEGRQARLYFPATKEDELRQFMTSESSCCPFFSFDLTELDGRLELRVGAPEGSEWAVRGLVAGFVAGWGGLI